jgi:hypothetical protein
MRYEEYSEDATLDHFDKWTDIVGKQLDRINHVESKLEELDDEVGELYVAHDYEERIADLESKVAKLHG